MSDLAKQLFDAAPGLKNFGPEVAAEFKRLGTQGAMELASALFNGHGFVPYGPGQYTPTPEHAPQMEHEQASHEMERD
jgi:hypothetical protein